MANPAAEARARVLAAHPKAVVVERGRYHIKHRLADGPDGRPRYVFDCWLPPIAGAAPDTINKQVGATGDDGRYDPGCTYFDSGLDDLYIYAGTPKQQSFARFTGISGLSGATITASYYEVYGSMNSASGMLSEVKAEYAEAPAAPTTCADAAGRGRTTAGVDWDGLLTVNDWNQSPSLNAVTQELADNFDPSTILILHEVDRTATNEYSAYRAWDYNNNTYGPKLHIEYTAGGATTLTPDPAVATAAVPSPALSLVRTLTPDPAVATAGVPSPATSLALTLTPTPAVAQAAVPSPVMSLALVLTPTPVVAVAAVPSPVLSLSKTLLPDPAIASVSVPSPALISLVILTPSPTTAAAAVPSPALTLIKTLLPTPVSALAVVPAPSIDLLIQILQPTPAIAVAIVPIPYLDVVEIAAPPGSTLTLLQILKEARQMAEEDRRRSPVACPKCGEPLDENRQGILNCPMGDWRGSLWERP